ncbi:MAG: MmcQ/YjbR family DNA-binding protein [Ignavibacterium sp.]|nr:MAG: MmcQ/YjbR family DNA-binding protein [Ignavibacterium sp.]
MNLELLEEMCSKLKETTKDIKWGNDLCFLIGEKIYCVAGLEPPLAVSLKVPPEEFNELTNREGIIPAPYLARYSWILIEDMNAFNNKEWQNYIEQSYNLIFNKLSKKTQRAIGENA